MTTDKIQLPKYFTGIGSRRTPLEDLLLLNRISIKLCNQNYILRSGGAIGADSAFEGNKKNLPKEIQNQIIQIPKNKKIIYTPKNFNAKQNYERCKEELLSILDKKIKYERLQPYVRLLFLRNINQVIGEHPFDNFSKFVICWTPHEKYDEINVGGTRIAVRLAQKYDIPVFNLINNEHKKRILTNLLKES